MDTPPVEVTARAAAKAVSLADKEGVARTLRLGVQGGGCSGLSYVFAFCQPATPADAVWHVGDLEVCVDPKSLKFLAGCSLDFEDGGLLKRGFRFKNPQAKQSCSCGESFTL